MPPLDPTPRFIEPMLLLPAERLPEGLGWAYELKLDGYRALGIKTGGEVRLRSRNDKDFNRKYPAITRALAALPNETVIDGEVVALDPDGRPSFSALQNGAAGATIVYYVFDVMVLGGRNVMGEPLSGVNYFFGRVDSSILLPAQVGCLMKMLPVENRHDGQQKREATEFGNQRRIDTGDCGALSRGRACRQEEDPRRVH
jgi:hypothetical protein